VIKTLLVKAYRSKFCALSLVYNFILQWRSGTKRPEAKPDIIIIIIIIIIRIRISQFSNVA